MRLDQVGLERVLTALGEQLATRTNESFALVVCGGSALQALGLIQRTTRDVDVLALLREDDSGAPLLVTSEPLPPALVEAGKIVGEDFKLPADWLNSGPTDLLREGLPEGCADRLHTFTYGKCLTVHFLDRVDLICLKTYAALNGETARHLTDLRALAPTDEEMLVAARWTLLQDAADFFPDLVRDFLRKVGFPSVADRL